MKKMICPNWLKCRVTNDQCMHGHVHDFIEEADIRSRVGGTFKGCNRVSTIDSPEQMGKECHADQPNSCNMHPCLRVACGGCLGVEEEDDLSEVAPMCE